MSEFLDQETLDKIIDWTKATDEPIEEITQLVVNAYNDVKARYKDRDEEFYLQRARFHVKSTIIDPILRSPSKPVLDFILGFSDSRDIWDSTKAKAIELYQKEPDKAILGRVVRIDKDAAGNDIIVPLDVNPTFKNGKKNPGYGKPLPYRPQRRVIGAGFPEYDKHVEKVLAAGQSLKKFIHLTMNKYRKNQDGVILVNNPDNWIPPLHTVVRLQMNLRRLPDQGALLNPTMYKYNDSARVKLVKNEQGEMIPMPIVTEVDPTEFSDSLDWDDPSLPYKLLMAAGDEYLVDITELSPWIDLHKDDYETPVIIEGWVSNINHNLSENQSSYAMEVQDMLENKVQCWVHPDIYSLIEDVGRRTNIVVIGSAYKSKDDMDEDRLTINVWGTGINYEEFYSRAEDPLEQPQTEEPEEE